MEDHEGHGCDNIGRRVGLLCAAIGVLVAAGIMALGLWSFIAMSAIHYHILVGLIALFFAAAFLGKKAGMFLCARGNRVVMSLALGLGVAFGSIAISVLTGSFLSILSSGPPSTESFLADLFGPLVLVCLIGGAPAIVLGLLWGCLVTDRLTRLDQ